MFSLHNENVSRPKRRRDRDPTPSTVVRRGHLVVSPVAKAAFAIAASSLATFAGVLMKGGSFGRGPKIFSHSISFSTVLTS